MSGLVKYYCGFFIFLFLFESAFGDERQFNLGTIASPSEVAGWNIDVRPDGLGAPIGSGNAFEGEEIYAEKCGFCHGDFGEGIDRWPELVGGEDSLNSHDPIKTTSSFWPYASTMYDYIYRAMPFGEAQSLSADETYSIVAYLLYMGDVIDEEFDVSNNSIGLIEMPNKYGFLLPDPRPDVEGLTKIPCMTNCRGATEVIGSAKDLDVTPEAEG